MPLVPHVAAGQIVASTWGNLVADHVVMRFTTAAQRTSQLTAPIVGQLTTLDSAPGVIDYWNGTAWLGLARRVGFGAANVGGSQWTTGQNAPIIWSNEVFDTDGFTAGGSTLTVPAGLAGVYSMAVVVTAGGVIAGNPTVVQILTDGVVAGQTDMAVGRLTVTCSTIRELAAGSTVSVPLVNGHSGNMGYTAQIRFFRVGL